MEIKLARFTGTTKSGYLKLEDHCDPEEDLNSEDEALLRERVARYHYLLRGNVHSYFIRMFYPLEYKLSGLPLSYGKKLHIN